MQSKEILCESNGTLATRRQSNRGAREDMGAFGNELKIHTETTPGRNTPIRPRRDSDGYLGIDKSFSARWDDLLFRTAYTISTLPSPVYILGHSTEKKHRIPVQIIPRRECRATSRELRFLRETFYEQVRGGGDVGFLGSGGHLAFLIDMLNRSSFCGHVEAF